MMRGTERHLADSIVYLCALLADRPRLIDRYINYFGETQTRDAETESPRDMGSGAHEVGFPAAHALSRSC